VMLFMMPHKMVLSFESVDEIQNYDHSLYKVVLRLSLWMKF